MSNGFVRIYKAEMDFAFSLYDKFLTLCPMNVWQENMGGRPIAQQFYHALSATAIYLESFTGEHLANQFPQAVDPFPETGEIDDKASIQPSKELASQFLKVIKTSLDKLTARLTDADLLQKNEAVSQFLGGMITNAAVLGIITGHMLYHLGSCDVALREAGIQGVFSGLTNVKRILTEAAK